MIHSMPCQPLTPKAQSPVGERRGCSEAFSASWVVIQIPQGRPVPSFIRVIFGKSFCTLSNIESLAGLPGGSAGCRVVAILFIPGPYHGHVGLSFHSPLRRAFEVRTLGQHILFGSDPLTCVESAFHGPHSIGSP